VSDGQVLITVSYSLLVVASIVAFLIVFRSTRRDRVREVDHGRLAALENRDRRARRGPARDDARADHLVRAYGRTGGPGAQRVTVRAQRFGWSVQPGAVRAGRPVEFRLTSKDVQHGFGVYEGTELLLQVQVPARGGEQRYVHTFKRPGKYEILCLEFCGFQEHMMRGKLTVN
jgi:plastocyanin